MLTSLPKGWSASNIDLVHRQRDCAKFAALMFSVRMVVGVVVLSGGDVGFRHALRPLTLREPDERKERVAPCPNP
jgi:hypothetical protein